jgi:predicted enzyme related to lactoylglutathione lyase
MRPMTSNRFFRYDLRTTDADAAQAFYADVLGVNLPGVGSLDDGSGLRVWPLHEAARARGVPAHWLGQIGVPDLEPAVRRLVELGSERLGPTVQANDGTSYQALRDSSGAMFAVRGITEGAPGASVAWHHLHTTDLDRSWAVYSELFGWRQTETTDAADPVGGYRMFAWADAPKSVGSMANTARSPGVHTHWLFYFAVPDLEAALAKVRARGGLVLEHRAVLPDGSRLAPCEDAQGAAFGLLQSGSKA